MDFLLRNWEMVFISLEYIFPMFLLISIWSTGGKLPIRGLPPIFLIRPYIWCRPNLLNSLLSKQKNADLHLARSFPLILMAKYTLQDFKKQWWRVQPSCPMNKPRTLLTQRSMKANYKSRKILQPKHMGNSNRGCWFWKLLLLTVDSNAIILRYLIKTK